MADTKRVGQCLGILHLAPIVLHAATESKTKRAAESLSMADGDQEFSQASKAAQFNIASEILLRARPDVLISQLDNEKQKSGSMSSAPHGKSTSALAFRCRAGLSIVGLL